MTRYWKSLAICLIVIGVPLTWAMPRRQSGQGQAAAQQGQQGSGARQAPTRGRTITLGDLTSFEFKDNIFNIAAGADLVRLIFYRDDIFRIWLGPDGKFTEAQPAP